MKAALSAIASLLVLSVALTAGAENQMASSKEELLWRMALAEQQALEQSHSLFQDSQLDRYLGELVDRLWKGTDTDLPPMTIRVIKNPEPNAVVFANGICYLTSGMLAFAETEDQLAMIIAHEVVHYIRRDSLEAYNREARRWTGIAESDAFPSAAERRADLEGMGLLRRAGYCPQETLALLSRFQNISVSPIFSAGASPMSFGERIAGIESLLAQEVGVLKCEVPAENRKQFNFDIAPALLANAAAALQRGIWEAAEMSITRYLEIEPEDPEAYYISGEIRLKGPLKDVAGGIMAFKRAIELDRHYLPAYRALGVLHLKAGEPEIARHYFEYCLKLAPQAPENAYIRGYLQLCQRDS